MTLSPRCEGSRTAWPGALLAAIVLSLTLAAPSQAASVPLGVDFRISNVGTDTDVARDAQNLTDPGMAYNATANEYLVVWEGDGLATDNELEIFGQRVSPSGAELGTDFRISNMGTDGDANRDGARPAVAYNPTANEYLVTWDGDGLGLDDEFEIFGQRVSAAGTELGTDFRISTVGTDPDFTRDGAAAAVAYNPSANEYLVSWTADGLAVDDELEVFGQRVSAAGAEVGTDDFRISNVGTDNDANRDAGGSAVAYNATANEYVVTWAGDGLATDNENEVFGQRVSAAGAQVGTDDFRISNVGTDGVTSRGAPTLVDFVTAVAYNATANEYLVTWPADGLATDNEYEVFGQRVSAAGSEVGTDDFRISNMGADLDVAFGGFDPAVAYSATANAYLVTWNGDGLATDDEFEVFGQDVSAAGTEVGTDFRISTTGTDGDAARGVSHPALAYNATANEFLVTWPGDDLATNDEYEIFGRRVGAPTADPDGDGDGVPDATDACPAQAGPPSNNGCPPTVTPPDGDGDGVPDASDACPTQAGPASNDGCPPTVTPPDGDGDGVPDATDACPTQAGPASNSGCPVTPQKPDNQIDIGKAKLNTKKGTARLPVMIPGAGELELSGKDVKPVDQQPSGAGTVDLPVKPKGKLADKLADKGKAKVTLTIVFTPTAGDPNDESVKVTLKLK